MAANIANIQLTVMQLPQVAHDQMPVVEQAALANAQLPAVIEQQDREAAETVQQMQQPEGSRIADVTTGGDENAHQSQTRQRRAARPREASHPRPKSPHPMGIGSLVDIEI